MLVRRYEQADVERVLRPEIAARGAIAAANALVEAHIARTGAVVHGDRNCCRLERARAGNVADRPEFFRKAVGVFLDRVARGGRARAQHRAGPLEKGIERVRRRQRGGPSIGEDGGQRRLHDPRVDQRPAAQAVGDDRCHAGAEAHVEQAFLLLVAANVAGQFAQPRGEGTGQVFIAAFQHTDGKRLVGGCPASGQGGRGNRAAIAAPDDQDIEVQRLGSDPHALGKALEALRDPGSARTRCRVCPSGACAVKRAASSRCVLPGRLGFQCSCYCAIVYLF